MTEEDVILALTMGEESMKHAIEHLQKELNGIRAGKATPAMVQGLLVPYYGTDTPLNQVATVTTADARTLEIKPWEKSMLAPIEKAIFEANLGVTPQNDGDIVRITVPMLTEERRRDLVKRAKAEGEKAKVSVRNDRKAILDEIKKAVKDGYPEDAGKRAEDNVQKLTDKYVLKVDEMISTKEKDILTI